MWGNTTPPAPTPTRISSPMGGVVKIPQTDGAGVSQPLLPRPRLLRVYRNRCCRDHLCPHVNYLWYNRCRRRFDVNGLSVWSHPPSPPHLLRFRRHRPRHRRRPPQVNRCLCPQVCPTEDSKDVMFSLAKVSAHDNPTIMYPGME